MGDLVLVVDNESMITGVDADASIVIDIEDKITTIEQEDTPENKLKVILFGMRSSIGEASNCATTYHNKMPQTMKQKLIYEKYIDQLSILTGKFIDSAKTGIAFNIPRHIAKFAKPVPYFMKYAGDYYKRCKKFLKSKSNMNRLCWDVEKWHNKIQWKRCDKNFDYKIMIDDTVIIDATVADIIEQIFLEYNKESIEIQRDERSIQRELGGTDRFEYNWDCFYDKYREKCRAVCPDEAMLANILVELCYAKYPKKTKNFMWNMAGDSIVDNIKQVALALPVRDEVNGDFEYLGKHYRFDEAKSVVFDNALQDDDAWGDRKDDE